MLDLQKQKPAVVNGQTSGHDALQRSSTAQVIKNAMRPADVKPKITGSPLTDCKSAADHPDEFEIKDHDILINFTDDLFWSVTPDFQLITANNAFFKEFKNSTLFSVKPDDNLLMKGIFPEEFLTFWELSYKRALGGDFFKEEIYAPACKKHKASWTETSFNPIYKANKIVGIACICRNITERKLAEERVKESELRYSSLIEQATDAVCIADASMKVIDINPNGCRLLGYTKEEFLTLSVTDIFDTEALTTNPLKIDELKSGNVIWSERKFKKKDGTIIAVEINAKILDDGRFVVFVHDITKRKRNAEVIKKAFEEKNTILERIDDGFFALDKNSIVTYWNKRAEILVDAKREEVIGKNLHEVFGGSGSGVFYDNYEKAIRENTTIHFTEFSARTNKWFAVSAYGSDNGLSVYFKDVTEQKTTDEKLKESELRYRSLIEQATDTICITDASFKFIEMNSSGCKAFGYSRKEILQLFIFDVLFDEDLQTNPFRIADLKAGKKITNERRIKKKDGTALEVELSSQMNEHGGLIIFGRDISERKEAEEKLKESELRYRSLNEQATDVICIADASMKLININPYGCEIFGYTEQEALQLSMPDILFAEDLKDNPIKLNELQFGKTTRNERRLKRKDGTAVDMAVSTKLMEDGRMMIFGHDVTERKQVEFLLKESNERYNLISQATNDMVWDWNLVTGEVYRNKEGWKKIFRTGEKEIENKSIQDWDIRVHPEDQAIVKQVENEIEKSEKDFFEVECRVLRDDGTYAYIHDRGNIFRNEQGKAVRLIGATQDITQRKEAELQVVKSEFRFRSLVQNSSDIICIFNDRGYFTYSSPAIKKIFGFEPEEAVGKNAFAFLHPDDLNPLKDYLSQMNPDKDLEMPLLRFKNSQGEWRWIESRITNMCDNPEVAGYVFNCRDITERKTAEAEIQKLSFIARETNNAVIITNPAGEIVWVNEGFTKITEFELEEVFGKKPGSFLQGEETNLAVVRFMRNKIKNVEPFECDIINYSKSGRKYWLRIQGQPQFDETGKLKYFFAIETDISKEKEAEQILKTSEERYRYLFNNNPASIFIWDIENFQILEVNDTAMGLYGYLREEFLTKTVLDLSLTEDHNKIKDFASLTRQKSEFKSEGTYKHINTSGKEMYMNISSHLIQFKGRQVILALSTNITDKIILENELENERQLKQQEITQAVLSAQERERQELGGELHDNVNQILAGSLLYLGLAKKELKIDHPFLKETDILINTAIAEIRSLSHSLIPPSLHESEFLDALKNIIEVTQKTSGIIISLQACGFDESSIPDKLKLTIYRIVQEQINNILKHAAAQKVIVHLVRKNDQTILRIKDDGVGFDTSAKANGVGLLNMKTRASLFNGEVAVISSPGHGCEVRVLFN